MRGEGDSTVSQITFGSGKYAVCMGTYGGAECVFITPADKPGKVGTLVPDDRPLVTDTLKDGETVLIFPTKAQAQRVMDALINKGHNE